MSARPSASAMRRVSRPGLLLAIAMAGVTWGQSTISRTTFASGGGVALSTSHLVGATMGQPVVASGTSSDSAALPGLWPTLDFELILDKPAGQGTLRIANVRGIPGLRYFMAVSADPTNAAAPPWNGFWFGLTIPIPLLFQEYLSSSPPFVGVLDGSGESTFVMPLPVLVPSQTFYAVTVVFGPNGSPVAVSTTPVAITI